MRHFWLDRVTTCERGARATGIKAVSLAEDEFDAHFPGNPVYPGVYLIEGLAQLAGTLLHVTTDAQRVALMVSVDRARFLAFARPGDQVQFEVVIESLSESHAQVRASAMVGSESVAAMRLSFKLVPREQLVPTAFQAFWDQVFRVWLGQYPGPVSD